MTLHVGRKPWITLEVIAYLEQNLNPEWLAFEWGCGGSTVWFATVMAGVYSVENHEGWYEAVKKVVDDEQLRATLHLVPLVDDEPITNGAYGAVIEQYPGKQFGLMLIDGPVNSRLACAHHALGHMLPGGLMVLDNSGSAHNLCAAALLDAELGHRLVRSVGPVYNDEVPPPGELIVETSVWRMR
jgi:hypothetical protein